MNLQEQILRIKEMMGILVEDTKKVDDPKKADLVSDNVNEFFKTLEDAANSGGLKQQNSSEYSYQKAVESMQIGLQLLGYKLPSFGVDGLFGPETASAVTAFVNDHKVLAEAIEFVAATNLIGKPGQGTHAASGWENHNAWDVAAPIGAEVKSLTDGKVRLLRKASGGLKKQGILKIYGDQVVVASTNGPDVFYTHIDSVVSKGQEVKVGDVIGNIMQVPGIPSHVHVALSSGNLSDLASNLPSATGGSKFTGNVGGGNKSAADDVTLTKASTEMLKMLIDELKKRGVKSQELSGLVDEVITGGGDVFTDLDLKTKEGYDKYAKICQAFIDERKPNLLGITGDMMAKGAKMAFESYRRYVPAELALAQLAAEGGIGNNNPNSRPIKTKNPFNVGNVDSGADVYKNNVQDGINTYYALIAKNYIGNGKTANDLLNNFVNKDGLRYASARRYEHSVHKLAARAHQIAKNVS